MPRIDFTVFTVAPALSETKLIGSIHASVAGTHRLRFTDGGAGGVARFSRIGVSKTDHGCGMYILLAFTTFTFSPTAELYVRATSIGASPTFYMAQWSNAGFTDGNGIAVRIFRVVAGVATLLHTQTGFAHTKVIEARFMVVGNVVQLEQRNVTDGELTFTQIATLVDPTPIAGPGAPGFGTRSNGFATTKREIDNWREFDAS